MPKIIYSSYFLRKVKKLSPQEKKLLDKFEKIFRQNCFNSRLKTHKLSGQFEGFWSCSLDYRNRVLFKFKKEDIVVLIDVGDHDVYK